MELNATNSPTDMRKGEKIENSNRTLSFRSGGTAWAVGRLAGTSRLGIDFCLMIVQSYPEVSRPHVIDLYRNGEPEPWLAGLKRSGSTLQARPATARYPESRCSSCVART
jgi:hypothetical protein